MAPFSLPAPCIIPLRLPVFGGPKSIDTNTKIQLLCETHLDHEIFYTLNGTKPQPYAGIVQGNKTLKYSSPLCLPPGKITIKAISINSAIHSMCSSVITKSFEVLKTESDHNSKKQSAKAKRPKISKPKKKHDSVESKKNDSDELEIPDEKEGTIPRFDTDSVKDEEEILDCFDEAFIGGSEFDTENSDFDDSIEDDSSFLLNKDISDNNNNNNEFDKNIIKDPENTRICDVTCKSTDDALCEVTEDLVLQEKNTVESNATLTNDSGMSSDTQFCCVKCDLTLKQCVLCNKMNNVSSKFCIGCGKQLSRICSFCKEYNPGIATFCQFCGKKLTSKSIKLDSLRKVDHSVMAKPASKNASIQEIPSVVDQYTQTSTDRSPVKNSSPYMKRIPRHSPGRGYWHQQVDYICNNLKSHAYNNVEFRQEISEPILSDFKSAHISKDEDRITVSLVFSPLVIEKYGHVLNGKKPKS